MENHQSRNASEQGRVGIGREADFNISDSEPASGDFGQHPAAILQRKLQGLVANSPQVGRMEALQSMANQAARFKSSLQKESLSQRKVASGTASQDGAGAKNRTGLPDKLKAGIENLSGYSLDDVKVHYNSAKPAQLQAHAYAQGSEIHLAPGQEKHLAHEAWHVVQQKQGRVAPTMQLMGGHKVNDNIGLEREADIMGARALRMPMAMESSHSAPVNGSGSGISQLHSASLSHGYGCGCEGCTVQAKSKGSIVRVPKVPLVQYAANWSDQPIQRVIAANPTAVDQAGMIAFGGAAMDMGLTNPIAGAVAPAYAINTVLGVGGYTATVVKTANADEGTSDAVYMQAGLYPTGLMFVGGGLGGFAAGPGNREIYGDLSAANSALSRLAELEHLDDLRRAFDITLGIADAAIDDAVANGPFAPVATQLLAQQAAENFMDGRIAHYAGIQGTAPFQITVNLLNLYQAKEQLTATGRDAVGFHTFTIDPVNVSNSPAAWAMYLLTLLPGVAQKDFRPIIPGANFNVPGPPSAAIIV